MERFDCKNPLKLEATIRHIFLYAAAAISVTDIPFMCERYWTSRGREVMSVRRLLELKRPIEPLVAVEEPSHDTRLVRDFVM